MAVLHLAHTSGLPWSSYRTVWHCCCRSRPLRPPFLASGVSRHPSQASSRVGQRSCRRGSNGRTSDTASSRRRCSSVNQQDSICSNCSQPLVCLRFSQQGHGRGHATQESKILWGPRGGELAVRLPRRCSRELGWRIRGGEASPPREQVRAVGSAGAPGHAADDCF